MQCAFDFQLKQFDKTTDKEQLSKSKDYPFDYFFQKAQVEREERRKVEQLFDSSDTESDSGDEQKEDRLIERLKESPVDVCSSVKDEDGNDQLQAISDGGSLPGQKCPDNSVDSTAVTVFDSSTKLPSLDSI